MSIDMSSVIPLIHTNDIKGFHKDYEAKNVRPVEEMYESGNADLRNDREEIKEKVLRDNLTGVGVTYSTRGELVTEGRTRQNGDNIPAAIDMLI